MARVIVLMGAPGAGKGTQARLLQEQLGLPQISTGDIFRALKNEQTPLAEEVRQIMAAGKLVPDEITIRLVRERTSRADSRGGYILDGFPRTPEQARKLAELAAEQGNSIQAIEISMPLDMLEKRMTGRRSCPICGEIYNLYYRPPKVDNVCDNHPQAQLLQRADDNPATVHKRLETYEEQTRPLLDYYRQAGLLNVVDGTREPEEIFRDIAKIVSSAR